ncbi:MAG: hypothetical protein UT34_C0002G0272 [candidate division WS6 bacterium GW2011_GWF2_39_15]|uniref:HD domain-containing protein n=1 Tax=candidate division WS6 bacterium GW2011_GWF2_39_15 TaxID=1619100 RepID=A0A0G0Q5S6_9BACT|nr:MAG: hypothetical protein UT34_C0002G0272 [candidate division WS6 bacterium GW2011_GWF2_39_15]
MQDTIYKNVENLEPVILELLETKAFKRLEYVSQLGVPKRYYEGIGFSRLEHSKGVFVLLRNLGASLEEQIAGLLHDISHMAFSHVIDHIYTNDVGDELLQDLRHEKVMSEFDSSVILKRYGYNPTKLAQMDLYNLLDRPIPYLCADRIDYSLRQFPLKESKRFAKSLILKDGRIVFNGKDSAKEFAILFLNEYATNWGTFWNLGKYTLMAGMLREGIKEEIICEEDLWQPENWILEKLLNSGNQKIQTIHSILSSGRDAMNSLPVTGDKSRKKFRYVDPEFLDKGKILILSNVDSEFNQLVEEERKKNAHGIETPDIDKLLR